MKKNFSILKTAYKRQPSDKLAAFATNVANLMAVNPAYAAKTGAVAELKILAEAFTEAVALARSRAILHVIAKNQLREQVIDSLDSLVDWLKAENNGDPKWGIDVGFEAGPKERKPANVGLLPPYNLTVKSTKVAGQAWIKFKLGSKGGQVKTNALEYSADNGVTWHNGAYGSPKGILLSNLPSDQIVKFKVRSLGAGSRLSGWSEVVKALID